MTAGPDIVYEGTADTRGLTTITVSWSEWASGSLDIVRISDGDIEAPSLIDAVMVSLLSWRRARDGDPVPDGAPRQGWWADAEFGSRLWLLQYAKATGDVLTRARDYAEEALAWLVDDGIAASVTVTTERQGARLALGVTISRPSRADLVVRFNDLWEAL